MVIGDHERESANTSRDRGQLILIGAFALAFILLGVVVVYNGVLFTETISSSSTGQSASHAELADEEVEQGIQGVIQRENLEDPEDRNFIKAIKNYDSDYLNATTEGRPVVTSVRYVDTVREANSEKESLPETDQRLASPNNGSIGHFVLIVEDVKDDQNVVFEDDEDTIVEIDDDNGEWVLTNRDNEECRVSGVGDRTVWIDLSTGTVNASSTCDEPFVTRDDEFANISIDGAEHINGSYELVYKGDGDGAWTVTVSYTYESNDVTVEKEREIDVYGDRP